MKYELSQHAKDAIAEREIAVDWLERVLDAPEKTEADKADARLTHHLSRIPEHDNRVLRVIFNHQVSPVRVVTAYFDRKNERQIMKLKVDEKADALYLRLDDSKIIESEEVSPGVVLDYNERNQVVGVEILNLSKRAPSLNARELQFQTV